MTADNDFARAVRSGTAIQVKSGNTDIPCTNSPTVTTTDTIVFNDTSAGGDTTAQIDLSGGQFAPGETPSELFTNEIDLQVHLGDGPADNVDVFGGPGIDEWQFGNTGATDGGNLNLVDEEEFEHDVDLVFDGAERLRPGPLAGNDIVRADALAPFTAPLAARMTGNLGEGDDTMVGGNGTDDITDGEGNDDIDLAGGSDLLRQSNGGGDDVYAGGAGGSDTVTYQPVSAPLRVDLGVTGPQQTGGGGLDDLSNVENVTGGQNDDILIGNEGGNQLGAQPGNDVLIGRGGEDTIFGQGGTDTVSYELPPPGATQGITLDLQIQPADPGLVGDPQVTGGAGIDHISGVENLTGSPFADDLTGNAGPNAIKGLGGVDQISALAEADTVDVRDGGADNASCGAGADTAVADVPGLDTIDADCETVQNDVRPDTTISAGPRPVSSNNAPAFAFSSTKPGSSFECAVDGGAFAACGSPRTIAPVADGAHTFAVRARDVFGILDLTPATRAFAVDTRRPAVSRLKIAKRFRLARKRTPLSAAVRRGSAFAYRLSEAASVTIKVQRCGKGSTARRCKRPKTRMTLKRKGKGGANRVVFTGRTRKTKLRPGRHRAVVTATDAAGNKTRRSAVVAFAIVR
jgi:Ca2+-binding RTX toxin-like protein